MVAIPESKRLIFGLVIAVCAFAVGFAAGGSGECAQAAVCTIGDTIQVTDSVSVGTADDNLTLTAAGLEVTVGGTVGASITAQLDGSVAGSFGQVTADNLTVNGSLPVSPVTAADVSFDNSFSSQLRGDNLQNFATALGTAITNLEITVSTQAITAQNIGYANPGFSDFPTITGENLEAVITQIANALDAETFARGAYAYAQIGPDTSQSSDEDAFEALFNPHEDATNRYHPVIWGYDAAVSLSGADDSAAFPNHVTVLTSTPDRASVRYTIAGSSEIVLATTLRHPVTAKIILGAREYYVWHTAAALPANTSEVFFEVTPLTGPVYDLFEFGEISDWPSGLPQTTTRLVNDAPNIRINSSLEISITGAASYLMTNTAHPLNGFVAFLFQLTCIAPGNSPILILINETIYAPYERGSTEISPVCFKQTSGD